MGERRLLFLTIGGKEGTKGGTKYSKKKRKRCVTREKAADSTHQPKIEEIEKRRRYSDIKKPLREGTFKNRTPKPPIAGKSKNQNQRNPRTYITRLTPCTRI